MDRGALLLAALSLAPLASGQEGEAARWISGQVLRADGSAWGGATVVLHSLPWSLPDDEAFFRRVETIAGADGTFRADVTPGHSYSVWALSEVSEERYTVTQAAGGLSAGQWVTLREREEAQRVVRVGVRGLEAWEPRAPFSFELLCLLDDRVVLPCETDAEGLVVLGPAPSGEVLLRVRGKDGSEIASATIPLGELRRRELAGEFVPGVSASTIAPRIGAPVTLSETRTEVAAPGPVPLRLALTGPKGPVRGARVLWTDRADRRLVAESDRKGRVELLVPALWSDRGEPALRGVSYRIEAAGCATVQWFAEDLACRDEEGQVASVSLSLPKGSSIEGRLSWSRGRPAAKVPLLVHTGVPSGREFEGLRGSFDGAPWVIWTDAKGAFEIDGLSAHLAWQISVFPPAEAAAELPRSAEHPLAPHIVVASGEDATAGGRDLGGLVLAAYRPLDVTVRSSDGSPAACVDLAVREELTAAMQEQRVARVRTDPLGRVRLLARPGSTTLLAVLDAAGEPIGAPERVGAEPGKRPIEVTLTTR